MLSCDQTGLLAHHSSTSLPGDTPQRHRCQNVAPDSLPVSELGLSPCWNKGIKNIVKQFWSPCLVAVEILVETWNCQLTRWAFLQNRTSSNSTRGVRAVEVSCILTKASAPHPRCLAQPLWWSPQCKNGQETLLCCTASNLEAIWSKDIKSLDFARGTNPRMIFRWKMLPAENHPGHPVPNFLDSWSPTTSMPATGSRDLKTTTPHIGHPSQSFQSFRHPMVGHPPRRRSPPAWCRPNTALEMSQLAAPETATSLKHGT